MELSNKSPDELKAIAKQLGIKVGRSSSEHLKAKITALLFPEALDQAAASGVDRIEHPKRGVVEHHWTSPEQLTNELNKRYPKMKLTIDASTWLIQNGAAEDSGPLAMPIGVILKKAAFLTEARFPAKFKGTGTDLDGSLGV